MPNCFVNEPQQQHRQLSSRLFFGTRKNQSHRAKISIRQIFRMFVHRVCFRVRLKNAFPLYTVCQSLDVQQHGKYYYHSLLSNDPFSHQSYTYKHQYTLHYHCMATENVNVCAIQERVSCKKKIVSVHI